MDIAKAASYGWDTKASIGLHLEDVSIDEFSKHSFLDKYLSPFYEITVYRRGKIRKNYNDREILIYHGHGEEESVSISTRPGLDAKLVRAIRDKYRATTVNTSIDKKHSPGIYGIIDGVWNAKKIGHKEVAEFAKFFDKVHTRKPFVTRLGVGYEKLAPMLIAKMKYREECVVRPDATDDGFAIQFPLKKFWWA